MQTILGPFHPYLETALVDEFLKHKREDRLCPLLILVPSDLLRRRLKVLLAREKALTSINVQLLTFHQLSLKLFAEVNGPTPPILRDDRYFEEVLRHIIGTRHAGAETFAGLQERAGGCAALWQTLRDLRDAMVDPAPVLEALGEGHFSRQNNDRTFNLLSVFDTLERFCAEKGIQDYSDLHKIAAARASVSKFLQQFVRIFYYGFYDLTQIQLDFFNAVAQSFPTTLLFPLLEVAPRHEGWGFAERFFQRYIRGRTGGSSAVLNLIRESGPKDSLPATFQLFDQMIGRPYTPLPDTWRCKVFNAFGAYDEVAAAAKEILRLVGDEAITFEEIGVVARSLEGYGAIIKEVFRAHEIPIAGSLEDPMVQFPLVKAAILLLNLPARNYLRAQVIDLISSPYFRFNSRGGTEARTDLWDLASRELGICKGLEEWNRLQRYFNRDLLLPQRSSDDQPRSIRVPAAQIRALAQIVEQLSGDLRRLPEQASWSHYANQWKQLLGQYLGIFAQDETQSLDSLIAGEILTVLDRIAGLDIVQPQISLNTFTETFQHWLERSTVAPAIKNEKGVSILDATAARGLCFRALFIIGLNEGVFPRTVREDPFLRDRDREILERDLGYKANQKLAAFDEEKLLFTLLVQAARERLYCLFQRADESGRVLAPSWYLAELRRVLGNQADTHLSEVIIPRSIIDKANVALFNRNDLLLPEELAVRLGLAAGDASPLLEAFGHSPGLYEHGRQVAERLDLSSAALDAFDGIIQPAAGYWRRFSTHGVSATALETYGRCPFQFFARHLLGLDRLERPEESAGPSAADFGELGHQILKLFYQEFIDGDYLTRKNLVQEPARVLQAIARRVFAEHEATHPVGYPLAWESVREDLTELLCHVVSQDLWELSTSGYVPIAVEIDMTERLTADWPAPLNGLTFGGRMDRIDYDSQENRLRVIDYKFKFGAQPTAQDNDLYRAALRGERLQPPVYVLLGKRLAAEQGQPRAEPGVEVKFYYIAARWKDGPLIAKIFNADGLSGNLGREIKTTIAQLVEGIQNGRFFIQQGDHCHHCEISEVCRKNHAPSLWRAENDPVTKPHRALRDKDPKNL
jgi:ATP-dependent helicase/nuclease subunit B